MDIHAFWHHVLTQDAAALAGYFHPEAVVRWHGSNEQFTAAEYIRANCEYPGDWLGEIQRYEPIDGGVCTVTRVYNAVGTAYFHVASFFQIVDGKILTLDEYWAADDPAPAWRQQMKIGKPII